jgi:hypothetical protein
MPFGASDTIRKAVSELLASRPAGQTGGFVIFDDGHDDDFVQFGLIEKGLYLFWPTVSRIPPEQVAALLPNSEIQDDGLYADFGRDVDAVESFTMRAFRELFGREPQELNVQLELES